VESLFTVHHTPHRTLHRTPHRTLHRTPHRTLHRTPHRTPRRTPHHTPHGTLCLTHLVFLRMPNTWARPKSTGRRCQAKNLRITFESDEKAVLGEAKIKSNLRDGDIEKLIRKGSNIYLLLKVKKQLLSRFFKDIGADGYVALGREPDIGASSNLTLLENLQSAYGPSIDQLFKEYDQCIKNRPSHKIHSRDTKCPEKTTNAMLGEDWNCSEFESWPRFDGRSRRTVRRKGSTW
jgi:hypothetical protein